MVTNIPKTKNYFGLLTPSASGLFFYTFIGILVVALNQVQSIQKYLELPANIEFTRAVTRWLDKLLTGTLGEGTTNAVVVGLFWAIVGLGVYMLLQALARFMLDVGEGFEERGFVWPKGSVRSRPLVTAIQRSALRVAAFFVLVYVLLHPLSNLLDHAPLVDFIGPNTALQFIFWFISIFVMLHCAVVLARIMVLRQRLFE